MRIYCIVSKESLTRLNGVRGKLTSQAGHAFLHAFWDAEITYPEDAAKYKNSGHAKKVTVVVDTDAQMLELYRKYQNICGSTEVIDAGLTVFKEPTLTCVGIGPIAPELVEDDLKQLKVLI